jgi:hypothetical protein
MKKYCIIIVDEDKKGNEIIGTMQMSQFGDKKEVIKFINKTKN